MDESHIGHLMPSACGATHGSRWMPLCVSVEETGCVRGLGGLEEFWVWDEDAPACGSLRNGHIWQVVTSTRAKLTLERADRAATPL